MSKVLLCSELVIGNCKSVDQDVCKCDLKTLNDDIDEWEKLTDDRNKWRSLIRERLRENEKLLFRRPKKKTKEPE